MCIYTGPSLVLMFMDPPLCVHTWETLSCTAAIHMCADLCASLASAVGMSSCMCSVVGVEALCACIRAERGMCM